MTFWQTAVHLFGEIYSLRENMFKVQGRIFLCWTSMHFV